MIFSLFFCCGDVIMATPKNWEKVINIKRKRTNPGKKTIRWQNTKNDTAVVYIDMPANRYIEGNYYVGKYRKYSPTKMNIQTQSSIMTDNFNEAWKWAMKTMRSHPNG